MKFKNNKCPMADTGEFHRLTLLIVGVFVSPFGLLHCYELFKESDLVEKLE